MILNELLYQFYQSLTSSLTLELLMHYPHYALLPLADYSAPKHS